MKSSLEEFIGHWRLDYAENWNEFVENALQYIGPKRLVAQNNKPDLLLKIDRGVLVFTVKVMFGITRTMRVPINTDYEEDAITGENMVSRVHWEGKKLVTIATSPSGDIMVTTREVIGGDELIVIMTYKGMTTKRYFKRK